MANSPLLTHQINSRAVKLRCGEDQLNGSLNLISNDEYFNRVFPNFFHISASETPPFHRVTAPYIILHAVQGISWIQSHLLPGQLSGAFVAVTDSEEVWEAVEMGDNSALIGDIDLQSSEFSPVRFSSSSIQLPQVSESS
ncbi:hypothetical protein BAUCODRAFT_239059 [Baudoinia panamericana UAMH 10762]|uniref:Uncharacterized protein n=1 Tax=Baudoinia panamericana (strain UAMH 10762) TaxID=717646 RepID=M2MA89_BAUPA|nr:uncharacterized protein BAUCODRAFT_239059 [Baudoinia panamericana UAMH 10762]EMC93391.1 hypothetical protein BAUCODRAFT_239059 [Baudoinia panamericana UAMH 10762]